MSQEISVSKVGAAALVAVQGRVVAGPNAESLVAKIQELVQTGDTHIILDLAKVTYLDSTGISALIRAAAAPKMVGGATRSLHLTKRINDTLQIARLTSGFEIFDDLDKAVASFPLEPSDLLSTGPDQNS